MADLVEDDTNSTLIIVCRDSQRVLIDLTGRSVNLRWRFKNETSMSHTALMTVMDQTEDKGKASYRFMIGELQAPHIIYDAVITESGGQIVTQNRELMLSVRERN